MNRIVIAPRAHALFVSVVIACLWLIVFLADAAEPMFITSASKQFVVRGLPQRSALAAGAHDDLAYLDPATLAVACERVKQAMARELGWGDRWRGMIYLNIHPARRDNEEIDIIPFRTERGWSYRLDLPDEISRRRLLEALVETLLLEFADRAATNESVELPPWLVEGLTAHLSQGPLAGTTLQAHSIGQFAQDPQLRAAQTSRPIDVDQALRQRVQANGALTVDQLSWPEFDESDAAAAEAYHYSSHFFVRELLRLRGGPDALCATLAMLPEHLNWQTAFLRGFSPYFTRMLDVEKWWSLTLMQWKSHEISVFWSAAEARQKFEEILYTPMEVRLGPGDDPHITPVALQTVLNDWDFNQQVELLQTKLGQLQAARLHCTPNLGAIVDGYRVTLEKYLYARTHTGRWFVERKTRAAITQAITELNLWDERRARVTAVADARGEATGLGPTKPRGRTLSAWSEPRPSVLSAPSGE